jgi:hypothetical protein
MSGDLGGSHRLRNGAIGQPADIDVSEILMRPTRTAELIPATNNPGNAMRGLSGPRIAALIVFRR